MLWNLHLPGISYQTMMLLLKLWGVLGGPFVVAWMKIISFHLACFVKIFCLIIYSLNLLFFCLVIALRVLCYFCLLKFKIFPIKLLTRIFVLFTCCSIFFFVLVYIWVIMLYVSMHQLVILIALALTMQWLVSGDT